MINKSNMAHTTPHFNGKIFLNPVPTEVMRKGSFLKVLRKQLNGDRTRYPARAPGPFSVNLDRLNNLPPDVLRITWLGHSGSVLEVDGKRLLLDPLWCRRASPFSYMGLKRFFDNPLPLERLPKIDALLLSQDHYDHLDRVAVTYLVQQGIRVITMLGVGDRLKNWGLDPSLIIEVDWWDSV